MRIKILGPAIVLSIGLVSGFQAAATGSVVVDRVVAVVNGDIITLSDLQREESIRKSEGKKDERAVLEDMIDRKLQMAAAKREGMDVTDKELADAVADIMKRNSMDQKQFEAALAKDGITLDQYRNELREQMTLSRTFNKFVRSGLAISDAEVKAYYDRNASKYALAEEIRISEIFFRLPDNPTPAQSAAVKEKAMAALARARKGESLGSLVRELTESETDVSGGDLGFMQRDQVVPEIEEATRALKPGEVAGPILAGGGLHVIRLEEIRKPVMPFEKVRDEITKTLYEQKMENTYRTWLQSLRSDANIENKL